MTDDKLDKLLSITDAVGDKLGELFNRYMEGCVDISSEDARTMADTALMTAEHIAYPRYQSRSSSASDKPSGDFSGPKPYEDWTGDASEAQIGRLHIVVARTLERYARDPKTKGDATKHNQGFYQVVYNAKWEGDLPKHWNHKDSPLMSGQVSYLMDQAEEAFPGLMDKGAK